MYIYICMKKRVTSLRCLLVNSKRKTWDFVLVKTVFYNSSHFSLSDRRQMPRLLKIIGLFCRI